MLLHALLVLAALGGVAAGLLWTHFCDGCAAVATDCPFLDHGDGSSLAACQGSCDGEIACNLINFDGKISDCVLRSCVDPGKPKTTPTPGYSVWGLASRPTPPPGCWPQSSRRTRRHRAEVDASSSRGALPPPASWQADIERVDKLYAPDDSHLDPLYDLPQLGNGFLGWQVMTDALFASGVFNGESTVTPSHRARIPPALSVPSPSGATSAVAWDVRRATYYRRSLIQPGAPGSCTANSTSTCTSAGSAVWVEQRWYAHRVLPSLLVMEVEVLDSYDADTDADADAAGTAADGAASSTASMGAPYAMVKLLNCPSAGSTDIAFQPVPLPPDAPYTVDTGTTLLPETNTSGTQGVAVLVSAWPENNVLAVARPGQTSVFLQIVRTTVETPAGSLVGAVEADWAAAYGLIGAGTLHSSHVAAWEQGVWAAGVEVAGGRADIARVINASLASLVGSIREDRPLAPAPTGLSGGGNSQTGYNGHVFWDWETWMMPPLTALQPNLAAAGVQYRLQRLAGARAKAASYTPPYTGAMFPWESAATGAETCPSWAATGQREIHISGDVAVAVWWLYRMQQQANTTWLRDVAAPLLSGIADFWVSRTVAGPGGSSGSPLVIDDVIPPDEYADHVNRSVYTDAVAKLALNAAAAAGRALGRPASEWAHWLNASAAINLLYNASPPEPGFGPGGWHPEYAGYVNDTIKQADVVLLVYPLQVAFGNLTPASRSNDLQYYAPRTDPGGPAMTWSMHSIGFLELGDPATASGLLNRSMVNTHTSPFAQWTESSDGSGAPNFLTGAGGFLQSVVYGYPRLRLNDTALTFSAPVVFDGATEVTLRGLGYLGNRLDVRYNATTVSFTLQPPAARGAVCGGRGGSSRAAGTMVEPASPGLPKRAYVLPRAVPTAGAADRTLAHAPLAWCQVGQVVMDGAVVEATPLVVVTAAGAAFPLEAGQPVALPVGQDVVVIAADTGGNPLPLVHGARTSFGTFADVAQW